MGSPLAQQRRRKKQISNKQLIEKATNGGSSRTVKPRKAKRARKPPLGVLVDKYDATKRSRYDMIRELVLDHDRVDVLAKYVLGYEPEDFHREMIEWQQANDEGLLLAFRGAAKTIYCNTAYCIWAILKNPNVAILLAADAAGQAQTFLRDIKGHFERNETLREIFGDYVTNAQKWAENEIIVNKRTKIRKESTITCIGTETVLPGRHFDIIIGDDLVTEDNARTEPQREKLKTFFYKTLMPCLSPRMTCGGCWEGERGRLYVIGTRYHENDLYGWLQLHDYENSTKIIGVLDENDQSVWEEMFPTTRLHKIRAGHLGVFETQYMCVAGKMLGGIFNPDHFEYYEDLPGDVFKWQGVDLASGQKAHNDCFAHATVAIHKRTKEIYVINFVQRKLTFPRQVDEIVRQYEKQPDVVRVVIEANGYQLVMTQQLKEAFSHVPVYPRYTLKDKVARAEQIALYAGGKPIKVKRGEHDAFVRHMCEFPNGRYKDLFDAFEIAVAQGLKGAKRRRREEPGLI